MNNNYLTFSFCFILLCFNCVAPPGDSEYETDTTVSNVWVSDLGNGRYKNPIIHADYSDPDVVRVGDDYLYDCFQYELCPWITYSTFERPGKLGNCKLCTAPIDP